MSSDTAKSTSMSPATAIIELNDTGIRVFTGDELRFTSPGYAVIDGNRLLIGQQARDNARLLPRWTNTRFWDQLNTQPLPDNSAGVRHHADLAFAHLEAIWQEIQKDTDQVIICVPGFYSREQLSLLLGMLNEAGIPVKGLVNTAVIESVSQSQSDTLLHLDVHLHRFVLTTLKSDGMVRQTASFPISETGLFTLWDRWANIIANQFIQTCRFDPLHHAETEQALFNQLPDWLQKFTHSQRETFELNINGKPQSVTVSIDQLMAACNQIYPGVVQAIRSHRDTAASNGLVVSHRFSQLPGIAESLSLLDGFNRYPLTASSLAQNLSQNLNRVISVGSVSYITSLPAMKSTADEGGGQTRTAGKLVTHLLINHHAYAIGSALAIAEISQEGIVTDRNRAAFTLFSRAGDIWLEPGKEQNLTLNRQPVSQSVRVTPGDQLTVAGIDCQLISAG